MQIFKFIAIFFLLILTGCTTTNTLSTQQNGWTSQTQLNLQQKRQQLNAIQSWSAQGNLAIRTQQKGFNASFNWRQNSSSDYSIALFGPLGTNRIQLTGNSQQVVLRTPNRMASAQDPEHLLQQQVGWNIPISNLFYWLRGLPAPYAKAQKSYDMNNHLVQMQQQGWHIIYLRYLAVNGIDLPTRIFLSNSQLQVRIIITNWRLV